MYILFSKRDRIAHFISMGINAIVATGILFALLHPSEPFSFVTFWSCGIFAFQLHCILFPSFIQKHFLKSLSPFEEQRILRKRIACLQEEIKRSKGVKYNEKVFHDF